MPESLMNKKNARSEEGENDNTYKERNPSLKNNTAYEGRSGKNSGMSFLSIEGIYKGCDLCSVISSEENEA